MRNSASATAALVARGVAFRAGDPRFRDLVSQSSGDLSRKLVVAAGMGVRDGSSPSDRFLVALLERLTVPGLSAHYVLRKRAIEEVARRAARDGFHQLVVIGAGLDTLAVRMRADHPDLNAIEVDHPATQKLKRDVLRAVGVGSDISFVAADLTTERLSRALERCGAYDREAATLFIAEAVFLYLDEEEVRSALADVRHRNATTRIAFTFFEAGRKRINFRNATLLADLWLRWRGEPPRWAIDPGAVSAFLESERFKINSLMLDEAMHRDAPRNVALARGEHLVVADA
ncbi:MAG: class I SAM-dependent methyltransferase [Thermoanaerobaculia bacterium]|nr:class I SAM-dependent methyltransferase [Thermoanaerobaculia bacterium]